MAAMTPTAADLAQARVLCREAGWCDRCEDPEAYTAPCEHATRIAQALAATREEAEQEIDRLMAQVAALEAEHSRRSYER